MTDNKIFTPTNDVERLAQKISHRFFVLPNDRSSHVWVVRLPDYDDLMHYNVWVGPPLEVAALFMQRYSEFPWETAEKYISWVGKNLDDAVEVVTPRERVN